MEHVSYEIVGFFIGIHKGEILDSMPDVNFTFKTVAVRVPPSGQNVIKETA